MGVTHVHLRGWNGPGGTGPWAAAAGGLLREGCEAAGCAACAAGAGDADATALVPGAPPLLSLGARGDGRSPAGEPPCCEAATRPRPRVEAAAGVPALATLSGGVCNAAAAARVAARVRLVPAAFASSMALLPAALQRSPNGEGRREVGERGGELHSSEEHTRSGTTDMRRGGKDRNTEGEGSCRPQPGRTETNKDCPRGSGDW
jgi:hypothetical protein